MIGRLSLLAAALHCPLYMQSPPSQTSLLKFSLLFTRLCHQLLATIVTIYVIIPFCGDALPTKFVAML